GQAEAHRAYVAVRGRAELGRALAEHLGAGAQLDMALEADYRDVGHANSVSFWAAMRAPSPRTSIARAARSSVGSASSGPRSCTALGSRLWVRPTGTVSPGMPARLAPIVKMSLRYIASGSSVFSPILKGSVGEAGNSMKSARAKASWNSRRIRVRAFCAVR